MSDPKLEKIDAPTDPGDWMYLGDHHDYSHYWVYNKNGKVVYECWIVDYSGLKGFRMKDCISETQIAGRDITDAKVALDFADRMMTQIEEHGEIVNASFEWP